MDLPPFIGRPKVYSKSISKKGFWFKINNEKSDLIGIPYSAAIVDGHYLDRWIDTPAISSFSLILLVLKQIAYKLYVRKMLSNLGFHGRWAKLFE